MQPTSYPRVNDLLDELLISIKDTLQGNLEGLYLYGSLVGRDFDEELSDIDLLAVVKNTITEYELTRLRSMHEGFISKHPQWNDRIEVEYVAGEALSKFKVETSRVVRISPGESLDYTEMDSHWLMDWYTVQEKGVTLFGPVPTTFIPHITKEEFIGAVKTNFLDWRDWINEANHRGYLAYVVLTMCRNMYALREGQQTSKKHGAEWFIHEFPEWEPLINRALEWRNDKDNHHKADIDALEDVRGFVEFCIKQVHS